MYAITDDNLLFGCGGAERNLGLGPGTTVVNEFTQIPIPGGCKCASTGGSHSLAVSNDGTLWGWGNNNTSERSSLGLGPTADDFYDTPQHLNTDTDWVYCSAGMSGQSWAIKENGYAYCAGNNYEGVLGIGNTYQDTNWRQLPGWGYKKIIPTFFGSLFLKRDGTAYCAGTEFNYEFGIYSATNQEHHNTQTRIGTRTDIVDIISGYMCTYIVIAAGSIYGAGIQNSCKNLGDLAAGEYKHHALISAGWEYPGTHGHASNGPFCYTIMPNETLRMFGCPMTDGAMTGYNYGLGTEVTTPSDDFDGNAGVGLTHVKSIFISLDGKQFYALTEYGEIRAWGKDNNGKLGQGVDVIELSTPMIESTHNLDWIQLENAYPKAPENLLEMYGYTDIPFLGAFGEIESAWRVVDGDMSFRKLRTSGTMSIGPYGEMTLPELELEGLMYSEVGAQGSMSIPRLTIDASVFKEAILNGNMTIKKLLARGTVGQSIYVNGEVDLPLLTMLGEMFGDNFVYGVSEMEPLIACSTAEVEDGEHVLEYQR
ncbi:MAG: hypothetical protein KAH23_01685 [Kiritimatiellae bacterium]|nr:hypothetical protein [Kiritimatiellia bacterium]